MICGLLQRLNMTGWRLSTRIVVPSLVLLMLLQTAVLLLVNASIDSNARRQVATDLVGAERVWRSLIDQKTQRLKQNAEVLAADSEFKTTVTSRNVATSRSALENYGQRSGAAITSLLDIHLNPMAVSADIAPIQTDLLKQIATPLQNGTQAGQLGVVQGRAYMFVMVPLRTPLQVSWILLGFATDKRLAEELFKLSNVNLALTLSTDGGKTTSTPIVTLPVDTLADLQQAGLTCTEFSHQNDTLIVRHVAIKTIGGDANALLVQSLKRATAPFKNFQLILLGITLMGLLLFGLTSVWTALRVTTPLRLLVQNAERLGLGQYDQPIRYTERRDEIGDLANAFDRMRKNIALKHDEIQKHAYWDRLTRLRNRVGFRNDVIAAIASRQALDGQPPAPLSIITLNLDRFKHVNDILGHALGDRLLVAVAERLYLRMKDGALLARLGGDEFSILLPHADVDAAMAMAASIAKAFEAPLSFDDQTVDLSASMGIACWPQHALDTDNLLGRAEIAMYVAKRKTTVLELYDAALDSSSNQTLSLLSELRHAVEHNELRLFLQPKIALDSGRVVAAEAVVRWQNPVRGLVSPDAFIPFAEQTGFVRQLTLWMFDEAARQWAGLQLPDQALRISVNLSTRDLLDLDFPARLDVLLAKHQVAPEGFCLEITESAIMDDPLRAESTLNRLSERGFKLSIDDFGTGYSSLAYLKRLPVNELKIDKSFVMGMERDPDNAKIVRSTIDLAHNMGLSVVAEGVENVEIWHLLREQKCDEAQGYFMGKPMPVDAFKTWRNRWAKRAAV